MPPDQPHIDISPHEIVPYSAPIGEPFSESEATEIMATTQEGSFVAKETAAAIEAVQDVAVEMPVVAAETIVSAVDAGVADVRTDVVTTQAKVKKNMDKAMQTAQHFMSFSQGNFEAMMKSGQIWAAGVQDIGKQVAATVQAHYDESMSVFKAMTSVKSLKEAFDLQSGLARTSMEKAVSETGRLTDASLKLAEEAIAPLTARVTLAVESFSKPV